MKDPKSMFMAKRLVLSEALSKHCVILAFLKPKSDIGRNEVSGRILPCHDLPSGKLTVGPWQSSGLED